MQISWKGLFLLLFSSSAFAGITTYDWSGRITDRDWHGLRPGDAITGTLAIDDTGRIDYETPYSRYYTSALYTVNIGGVQFANASQYDWVIANDSPTGNDAQGFSDSVAQSSIGRGNFSMSFVGKDSSDSLDIAEAANLDDPGRFSSKGWGMEVWEKVGNALYYTSTNFWGVVDSIVKRSGPVANSQLSAAQVEESDSHS